MGLRPELRYFGFKAHDAKIHYNCASLIYNHTVEIYQPMIFFYPESTVNSNWDPERRMID